MFDAFGSDILAALLLLIVIVQLKRLQIFANLTKVRLRAADGLPIARAELPAHVRELLDHAAAAVARLGFEPVCTLAADPPNVLDPRTRVYADLHWHPELAVLARVDLAEVWSGQATRVEFTTAYADGGVLTTVNREAWAQLSVPDGVTLVDVYADDLAGQWQAHQEAMGRQLSGRTPVTERGAAIRQLAAFGHTRWFMHAVECGCLREESPGRYRFTPGGAWRFSARLARPPAVARRASARPYHHDPEPSFKAVCLAEMDTVAASIALGAEPLPAWMKTLLFVLTLVLSALLFGNGFGLQDAAALLAVLLVHELGHLAAMRVLGYRNLSIFFLPFLGAAATGHKPHAEAWQEAVVLLAGPVGGLLVAFAASQVPAELLPQVALEFLRAFVWLGVVLNVFNLLPFGVLDGGRLFELAVLGRFPRGRAVFALLGVVLGLVYAVWAESFVMGLAMLLLLFGISLQFKAARVVGRIRTRARAAGVSSLRGEQALAALGREFASGDYGRVGAADSLRRVNIARLAYPRLLQGVPGFGVSMSVLLGQAVAFLAPLLVAIWSVSQSTSLPLMRTTATELVAIDARVAEAAAKRVERPEDPQARKAQGAWVARFEAEPDPAGKWTILEEYEAKAGEDFEGDAAYFEWLEEQRRILTERLPEDHPGRLQRRLDQAAPGTAAAAEVVPAVIAILGGNDVTVAAALDERRFALLIEAYGRLAQESASTAAVYAGTIEALWSTLQGSDSAHGEHRPELARILARVAFAAGRVEEAEGWMRRYRDDPRAAGEPLAFQAELEYAWFLVDARRHEQALAAAGAVLAQPDLPGHRGAQWATLAGWAEMGRGRPREADARFQQAQAMRMARIDEVRGDLPWWLRLLSYWGDTNRPAMGRIDVQTLDHLAALQEYQPQEAARLLAELAGQRPAGRPSIAAPVTSTYAGWGQQREQAHQRLLKALGV